MKTRFAASFCLLLFVTCNSLAESKRIEVYKLSQQYWDTRAGETLSEISQQLLPNNPRMQQKLMDDILKLNSNAFINGDVNRMQANLRLWLPSHLTQPDTKVDPNKIKVETYSWGNIKKTIR